MKTKITLVRRITQVAAFLLILYGAFIWSQPIETPFPRIKPSPDQPRTTKFAKGRILWVSGRESVFDIYLPTLACRFVAKGGLFKSCDLHCFSENITWLTSIKIMLPHIALFVALSFAGAVLVRLDMSFGRRHGCVELDSQEDGAFGVDGLAAVEQVFQPHAAFSSLLHADCFGAHRAARPRLRRRERRPVPHLLSDLPRAHPVSAAGRGFPLLV